MLYLAGIVASAWPSTSYDIQSRAPDPTTAEAERTDTAKPRRRSRLRKGSRRERPATSIETLFGLVIIVGVVVVVGGWLTAVVWLAVDGDWETARRDGHPRLVIASTSLLISARGAEEDCATRRLYRTTTATRPDRAFAAADSSA